MSSRPRSVVSPALKLLTIAAAGAGPLEFLSEWLREFGHSQHEVQTFGPIALVVVTIVAYVIWDNNRS
jgi:hypothetical protein